MFERLSEKFPLIWLEIKIAVAVVMAIALFSHSPYDPGLFTASFIEPTNSLGYFGAYLSSYLYIPFGVSAYVLPFALVFHTNLVNKASKAQVGAFFMSLMTCVAMLAHTTASTAFVNKGGILGANMVDLVLLATSDLGVSISIGLLCAITLSLAPVKWAEIYELCKAKLNGQKFSPKKPQKPVKKQQVVGAKNSNPNLKPAIRKSEQEVTKFEVSKSLGGTVDKLKAFQAAKDAFAGYKIAIEPKNFVESPSLYRIEFSVDKGLKTSAVQNVATDVARMLKVASVRVLNNIQGTDLVGIEVPKEARDIVRFGDLNEALKESDLALPMPLGVDTNNKPVIVSLAAAPHTLLAGTTGSGKSVLLHNIIIGLTQGHSSKDLRLAMIDPKLLEFNFYRDIPHLMHPIITEPAIAVKVLEHAVEEMERRYAAIANAGCRDLSSYNTKVATGELGSYEHNGVEYTHDHMPYYVIIIDEFADLMMTAGKAVEACIMRIAQKARAAGIHTIIGTQRPSAQVLTGVIKANIPTRIALSVASQVDSRVILDASGADKLLGHGDMLYTSGTSELTRIQSAFVSEEEVEQYGNYLRTLGEPDYAELADGSSNDSGGLSDLLQSAYEEMQESNKVSISHLQRKFKIGYNKAATIMDELEEKGMVTGADGSGKRQLL